MGQTIAQQQRALQDGLTAKRVEFVRQFVALGCSGQDAHRAAEAAGYAPASVWTVARDLLQTPAIRAAIRREQSGKLATLANEAIEVVGAIMRDEDAPAKVRLEAAKCVLDRAGFAAAKAIGDAGTHDKDKPVSEMTREELRAILDQARRTVAGDNADVIDAEVVKPADSL